MADQYKALTLKELKHGVLYQIIKGLAIDFIVVAPQCQSGWDNNKLLEVLNYAETKFPVDQDRVYLTGMSMGGYGCWQFAKRCKKVKEFAALGISWGIRQTRSH